MSKYAGTQTEKNLEAAFAGESQARNKYTAEEDGFSQASACQTHSRWCSFSRLSISGEKQTQRSPAVVVIVSF